MRVPTDPLRTLQCVALILTALACSGGPALAQTGGPIKPRPNIVFVLLDDAGFSDFGAYGSEIATPHIDSLAMGGARSTNVHTASTCEASRVMLQAGIDNHRAGAGMLQVAIADNQKGKPGYEGYLSDDAHSLGQQMRDGGYATYYAGKWNIGNALARSPGARGWDNHFITSQANPHVLPFLTLEAAGKGVLPAIARMQGNIVRKGSAEIFDVARRHAPTGMLRNAFATAHAVSDQVYAGNDMHIQLPFRPALYAKVLSNPNLKEFQDYVRLGERATWPQLAMIRDRTRLSRLFGSYIGILTQRMAAGDAALGVARRQNS